MNSETLAQQEAVFARAFARGDVDIARPLYHPEVVYLSPTVRLFDWPARIEGVEPTLAFIALTIRGLQEITYRAVEQAITTDGESAFVRIHFDWRRDSQRLRGEIRTLEHWPILTRVKRGGQIHHLRVARQITS